MNFYGKFVYVPLILIIILFTISADLRGENLFLDDNYAEAHFRQHQFSSEMIRSRKTTLNPRFREDSEVQVGDVLSLNLFPESSYSAVIDRKNKNINGTVAIRARIVDYPLAYMILSTTGNESLGLIRIPEKNESYEIMTNNRFGSEFLIEINESIIATDMLPFALIPPEQDSITDNELTRLQNARTRDPWETANIDVMIVYTPAAANVSANINNVISQSMEIAQLILDNSETILELHLVHSALVDYVETGDSSIDLRRLTASPTFNPWGPDNSGYMDEVHIMRDYYGADLVALFTHQGTSAGVAWLLNTLSGRPNYGFSITRIQYATSTYTHIHEMGHNMGLHHHSDQVYQPGPGIFPYSAGWRWTGNDGQRYCSVMTYESGQYFPDYQTHTRTPYFSNPDLLHQGVPTGHAELADNARTVRETKHVVAAYRELEYPFPRYLSATIGFDSITLSWDEPFTRQNGTSRNRDPESYNIYRNNSLIENSNTNSYIDFDLVDGVEYTYYVTALYQGNESIPSNIVTVSNGIIQIGSGNSVNPTNSAVPININYRSLRGQMVYTAAELNDAGFYGPGLLTHLGFYVQSPPIHNLPDFMIRMKHTTNSNASTHDYGPYHTALLMSYYAPSANSWNMLELDEPFYWNGTDNILVDTVFSRVPSFNPSGQQLIFDYQNGFRYARSDSFNQTNSVTLLTVNYKPQIRFKFSSVPLLPPQNLTGMIELSSAMLSWDAPSGFGDSYPEPSSYNTYRNNLLISEGVHDTSYVDSDLLFGISYQYQVTAVYLDEESEPSNSITLQLLPQSPEDVSITINNGFLTISWLTDPVVDSYIVEYANRITDEFVVISPTAGSFTADGIRTYWTISTLELSEDMMFFRIKSSID